MEKLVVIGSLNMDFVIEVEHMPQTGETILGNRVSLIPGGKGANQAYALGRLGCSTEMIGVVGDDIFGRKLVQNLEETNVKTDGIKVMSGISSGQAFINVDDEGENSIIVIPGANQEFNEAWINENSEKIEDCDAVVMQLEIPLPVVTYAARLAKKHGKVVILDPAPAVKKLPDELLECVDIIKPNETELEILAGRQLDSESEIVAAALEILEKGVKVVIVTLGGKGAIMITQNAVTRFESKKVEAVDTTAAGDSFTAAFIADLEDDNYTKAVEFAISVAAIVVTRKGAQTSIPALEEVTEACLLEK